MGASLTSKRSTVTDQLSPTPSIEQQFTLVRPRISIEQALSIALEHFGVDGDVTELGSQQDRNFRIRGEASDVVLKIANEVTPSAELDIQNQAMTRVGALNLAEVRVPAVLVSLAGEEIVPVVVDGQRLNVRLLEFVAGSPFTDRALDAQHIAALGRVAGLVARALEPLEHPAADRGTQWDLRRASEVVEALAKYISDPDRRAAVLEGTARASAALSAIAEELPVQVVHGDITDDNAVSAADGGVPDGVIDFGDVASGWRVAELVVGSAAVLHHHPAQPWNVLPGIRAFDDVVTLTDAEISAIWPLIVLRGAVLVASGQHQVAIDADNDYASSALEREWRVFEVADEIDFDTAELAIRAELGRLEQSLPSVVVPLVDLSAAHRVDLSVTSRALDAGRWLHEHAEAELLAEAARAYGSAVTTYGERRLTRAGLPAPVAPSTLPLVVEAQVPEHTRLVAPFACTLVLEENRVRLVAGDAAVWIDGITLLQDRADTLGAGDAFAEVTGVLAVEWVRHRHVPAPAFVAEDHPWLEATADPSVLLGLEPREPLVDTLLARRDAVFARVQEHYYAEPPRIERGWMQYLVDSNARPYLDIVNNVTVVGHGHPRLADAAHRQWSLLNTNSRFHYEEVVRYSERLAELAPDGLDTVFLVNSGTEAVDLALRLAQVTTDRSQVVAVREAYHGWSIGADAVSSSIGDNPRALETRPDWVSLADTPNPFRGTYRGADSAPAYLRDLATLFDDLDAAGRPPAAYLAEPVFGNGGGVLLPDGYLAGAFALAREHGALCIADEVQVGFGRLGEHFWGSEQQAAIPDIITVAKSVGNGHPLGAVITTRAIAEAFAADGSFFSSAGGSPVSAVIGNTVLDLLEEGGLIENARVTGGYLRAGLARLAEKHESIGAVHGMGFYLGVEFVTEREGMTPDARLAAVVCDRMLDAGVIVQPTGDHKNVLKIKPPMVITTVDADFFVAALDRVLGELEH